MSETFTSTEAQNLPVSIAVRLRNYLLNGDIGNGATGLNTGPQILLREGSGVSGDASVTTTAQVLFPDDEDPGQAYVRIVGLQCLGEEDIPVRQNLAQWRMLLDVNDHNATGAITSDVDPATQGATLAGAVLKLLRNRIALRAVGFGRTKVVLGSDNNTDLTYPLSLEFQTVNDL